jgi:hypothetical protein
VSELSAGPRKGGRNTGPSQVETRPADPAPMRPKAAEPDVATPLGNLAVPMTPITLRHVAELAPYARNARRHSPR